jgi:hypothetical protein
MPKSWVVPMKFAQKAQERLIFPRGKPELN